MGGERVSCHGFCWPWASSQEEYGTMLIIAKGDENDGNDVTDDPNDDDNADDDGSGDGKRASRHAYDNDGGDNAYPHLNWRSR